MDFNIEVRENGGGIVYHLDRKGEAFVIYNDPNGMLIKVKREGKGALPVSMSSYFTTFEKAQQEVERYLFSNKKKTTAPKKEK